jgi:type IV fimbrial biogenesis protein FimT
MPGFFTEITPRAPSNGLEQVLLRSQTGFTVIELMIVVVIVAVLTVIGLPSYKYVISSNTAGADINTLLADMQHARTEAVKQGQSVEVCAANTASYQSGAATFACSGSTTWKNGWMTCLASACAAASYATGLIRLHAPLTSSNYLTGTVSAVTFNYFGFSNYATGGSITDTPTGAIGSANQQKTLCVSGVGNLQTVTGDNTTCP